MTTAEIRAMLSELREQRAEIEQRIAQLQAMLDGKRIKLHIVGGGT